MDLKVTRVEAVDESGRTGVKTVQVTAEGDNGIYTPSLTYFCPVEHAPRVGASFKVTLE